MTKIIDNKYQTPLKKWTENFKTGLQKFLHQIILQATKDAFKENKINATDINFEHPENENYGDYSTNLALILAGRLKIKPMDLAKKICNEINKYIKENQSISQLTDSLNLKDTDMAISDVLEKTELVAPGFINIFINKKYLITLLEGLLKKEKTVVSGKNNMSLISDALSAKKIMVEFAHPNTHKAFHIGHLRNISTGESLVRILQACGAKLIRSNYQGDVGMHIAKCLYGILQIPNSKFHPSTPLRARIPKVKTLKEKVNIISKSYSDGSKAFEDDKKAVEKIKDINYLIYAAAQKYQSEQGIKPSSTDYFKFVEGKSSEFEQIYDLWKETRQWSLDAFESIYKRVNSYFDRYYFESECLAGIDIAKNAVNAGILKEDKGAIIFDGKPYGLDTRVFVNSLGLPTYEAKELALAQKEFSEFGKLDLCMHIVTPEQTSFFQITFKVEELLDNKKFKDKQFHFAYEWVRLKTGKMSSREGNVILGEWLLDVAKNRIKAIMKHSNYETVKQLKDEDLENIAEKVAVAAVKYSMLRVNPHLQIAFDIDESVSLEGESGPYLMYTYARCRSVLRKANIRAALAELQGLPLRRVPLRREINDEELAILRTIYRFEEVVVDAAKNLAPNLLCSFLFDLAQKYNLFYNKHSILTPDNSQQTTVNSKQTTDNKKQITDNKEQRAEELKQVRDFRLLLTEATATVIKQGLYLLGIATVERM